MRIPSIAAGAALLAALALGAPASAEKVVGSVGLTHAGEGWALAKSVTLTAGGTLRAIEVTSNDPLTVFPEVRVVRNLEDLARGTPLATSRNVGPLVDGRLQRAKQTGRDGSHMSRIALDPVIVLPEGGKLYVVVSLPGDAALTGTGSGPGIALDGTEGDGSSWVVSRDGSTAIALGGSLAIRFEGTGLPAGSRKPVTEAITTRLAAARPSPFESDLSVEFDVARDMWVDLAVYDVGGRLITTLQEGVLPAGSHIARWDGTTPSGERVGGGVYFLRFRTPDRAQSMKILKLR